MLTNPKAKCCRRRRSQYNDEPCVPDPNYVKSSSQPFKHPLRTHAMNNAEILASVQAVSGDIRGPEGCSNPGYDCYMTEQKKNYGHPLYHKMYMKTCQSQNYPVHYTVPPVDYHTYLQRQKEQMRAQLGRNFEQTCYATTKDMEKAWRTEEFTERYRPGKPIIGVCPQCKAKRLRKNLPHCCSCRCAYFQKLGWQNVNPACKQGGNKCKENIVIMKSLPIKKSYSNPHTYCSDFSKTSKQFKFNSLDNCGVGNPRRGYEVKNVVNRNCPPNECYDGQASTYRDSYQSRKTSSSSNLNDDENFKSKSNNEKPDWDKSIKLAEKGYVPTLAAAEAKLEELETVLGDSLSTLTKTTSSEKKKAACKDIKGRTRDKDSGSGGSGYTSGECNDE